MKFDIVPIDPNQLDMYRSDRFLIARKDYSRNKYLLITNDEFISDVIASLNDIILRSYPYKRKVSFSNPYVFQTSYVISSGRFSFYEYFKVIFERIFKDVEFVGFYVSGIDLLPKVKNKKRK